MITKLKTYLFVHSNNKILQRNSRIAFALLLSLIMFGVLRNIIFLYISNRTEVDIPLKLISVATQLLVASSIFAIYLYLVRMANQFSADFEQQEEQLERSAIQLQKVAEVTDFSRSGLDLHKVFSDTAENIREQFDFCLVALFLLDNSQENLILETSTGDDDFTVAFMPSQFSLQENSIASVTAVNRKPYLINDTHKEETLTRHHTPHTQAELTLPLIARNKLLGVLDLQSNDNNAFKVEDIAVLKILANQIAINIDNAHLFAETETRLNETRALYDFNLHLSATNDLGEIYRRAARKFAGQFKATRCTVCSIDRDNPDELIAQADFWYTKDGQVVAHFQPDTQSYVRKELPQTSKVLKNKEPLIYQAKSAGMSNEQECLEVPIMQSDNAMGTVRIYRYPSQSFFHLAEIQLAQAMANQTAVSLANTYLTTEAQGRVAQLSTLYRMSLILSEANTLQEVFDGGRREILSLIEASGISIVLRAKDENHLQWVYAHEYGQELDLSEIPPLPITQGFSGYVFRTQETLYITKGEKNLEKYNTFFVGEEMNTWLGLPMVAAGNVIGVLAIESEDLFSQRDVELLKTIVGPLAVAINNLLQFTEIETALNVQSQQRLHLQTAAEIAAAAASVLNQEQLIGEAVELIKERFQLYYVGLFLVDEKKQQAVLRAGSGQAGKVQIADKRTLLIGGQSLIGGATADGVPRITQDVNQAEEWQANPALPDTKSELAIPLHVRNKIIGALTVQSTTPNLFAPEMISTLQTMCDQLAIAIENAQLLRQAEKRAQREQKINQVSAQLHQSSDVDEIIGVGLQALSAYLEQSKVDLYLGRTHRTQTKPLSRNGPSA